MTDVFLALAETLPKPGTIFPIADRIRWLRAFAAVADYVFHTDESEKNANDWVAAAIAKHATPDVVPAPMLHKVEASDPVPPLAKLHLLTGMVEVDWADAERLLKDGTEAQRLQAMLLIGLRDDKFFTMGETPAPEVSPTMAALRAFRYAVSWIAADSWDWTPECREKLVHAQALADAALGPLTNNQIAEIGRTLPIREILGDPRERVTVPGAEPAPSACEVGSTDPTAPPPPAACGPSDDVKVTAATLGKRRDYSQTLPLSDRLCERHGCGYFIPAKRALIIKTKYCSDECREIAQRGARRDRVAGDCGCGRSAAHYGRCWFRRGLAGPGVRARKTVPEAAPSSDAGTPISRPIREEPGPVPDMPTHATEVDGAIVHGNAPLTPTDRAAASEVIGVVRQQLRDNGFRPSPQPRPAAPERRAADQDAIDAAIAAGKLRHIPSPGDPGFHEAVGELVRDPETKKEKRVATPHIEQITIVLQFLRGQGDMVVGSSQEGLYTVNGAQMAIDEVLARANRIRARQHKEPFRLEA